MDKRFWHILQVASGFEVEVAQSLRAPAYVPRKAISFYNRRKRVNVRRVVPALPGFIFVQSAAPQTVKFPPRPEIFGFMRNGNRTFSVLQPRAFEALVELEKELLGVTDAALGVKGDTITVKPGDAVTAETGVFAGNRMVVKEIRGDRLLVELVEASLRIELQAEQVRAA